MPDPFTKAYQAIRAGWLAWKPLIDAGLAPGKFPDMTDPKFQKFTDKVDAALTPEFVLMNGQFNCVPFGHNSMVVSFDQVYPLIITHESLKLAPVNLVKYETFRALVAMPENLGLDNVRTWSVNQCADDCFGQPQWMRDTQRWLSVLQVKVEFEMPKKTILAMKG